MGFYGDDSARRPYGARKLDNILSSASADIYDDVAQGRAVQMEPKILSGHYSLLVGINERPRVRGEPSQTARARR